MGIFLSFFFPFCFALSSFFPSFFDLATRKSASSSSSTSSIPIKSKGRGSIYGALGIRPVYDAAADAAGSSFSSSSSSIHSPIKFKMMEWQNVLYCVQSSRLSSEEDSEEMRRRTRTRRVYI